MRSVLSRIRGTLVAVKDHLDGVLHPGRRARARKRLRRLEPSAVLFVCLGNVCRSPYAERLLGQRAHEGLTVGSSGFIGPGRPPPDEALRTARESGIDHGDHRSTTITEEELRGSDAVFFFDRFNRARLLRQPGVDRNRLFWLGDFDTEWEGKRSIVDPWGKPREEFRRVFRQIERCVAVLADEVTRGGSPGP